MIRRILLMLVAAAMAVAVSGVVYIWGWKMILNPSLGLFSVIIAAVLMGTAIKEYVIWIVSIRPFLKENGEDTAFVLWSWAPLNDYLKASRLAERLRNRPKYLDEYWFYSKIQIILVILGGVVVFIATRFDN